MVIWALIEIMYIKCLKDCLAHRKYSLNVVLFLLLYLMLITFRYWFLPRVLSFISPWVISRQFSYTPGHYFPPVYSELPNLCISYKLKMYVYFLLNSSTKLSHSQVSQLRNSSTFPPSLTLAVAAVFSYLGDPCAKNSGLSKCPWIENQLNYAHK